MITSSNYNFFSSCQSDPLNIGLLPTPSAKQIVSLRGGMTKQSAIRLTKPSAKQIVSLRGGMTKQSAIRFPKPSAKQIVSLRGGTTKQSVGFSTIPFVKFAETAKLIHSFYLFQRRNWKSTNRLLRRASSQ